MGAGIAGSVLGSILNRPTSARKALNAQLQSFNTYMNSEAKTEGFDASSVFQNLMAPMQRIVSGGPNQAGWSLAETNAYNTQAMQQGAAAARNISAASGLNGPGTAGAVRQAALDAQAKAAAATSARIAQGTIQSAETGRQNFFNAVGEEKGLPGVFATSNEANREAVESNTAAQKSQQNIDTASKSGSFLGIASKALSGLGGAASSPNATGIKGLATPPSPNLGASAAGGATDAEESMPDSMNPNYNQ
jgi:hypothetical protein